MKITKQSRKMLKSRAEFKREVLKRDNFTCLNCGWQGTHNSLDADHVTGRVSKIDDCREAGATVCGQYGRCNFHREKTDGKAKWKASQLPGEVIKFIEWRKWPMWKEIIWDRK